MFNIFKKREKFLLGLIGLLFVFILWYFITEFKMVNPLFLSKPVDVISEEIELFRTRQIFPHVIASFYELSIGFIFAVFLGICSGYFLGWNKKFLALTKPMIYGLYATPMIAILPIIIIWFGLGLWSKVVIIFLASFFPILISTTDAVRNIDQSLLRLAKSFKAPRYKLLTTIVFFYTLPNVLSGIRIALPRAIVGMIVAEFLTGNIGLGYLISYYGATFQTAKLIAVIFIIVVISIFSIALTDLIEKKVQSWKSLD